MYTRSMEIEIEANTPEHRLWLTVLVRAVQEWLSGPKRIQRMAEDYLFKNTEDFATVCHAAGLDPKRFRNKLTALRNRHVAKGGLAQHHDLPEAA